MYYPDEIVDEVRSRSNIVDIIGGYVRLQKKGRDYFGLCPFHNEKSPSFSVSSTKQMYYCFGCGAGGNVFTFVMEYENQSFSETLKLLADRVGVALPEIELSQEERAARSRRQQLLDIHRVAAQFYYYLLCGEQGKQAMHYLTGRALSAETIQRFGLGYASKYSNSLYRYLKSKNYADDLLAESGLVIFDEKRGAHDRFWNRIMFPIMDVNNKVIGFGGRVMGEGTPKYLNSPETLLFDKSRNLYGLNYARSSRKNYLIICEGYMDVIAMHQAGFTNAVASLGTAFTASHSLLLKRYTQEVRLAYDSDDAGVRAAMRAIPILKSAGLSIRVINMSPYKDPDEFIKNKGTEAFEQRIEEAQSSFMFEVMVMEKDYKQSDPESRAAFMKAVAKKLLEFPEEMERNIYIESIAARYGISGESLKKTVNRFGSTLSPSQVISLPTEDDGENRKGTPKREKEDAVVTAQKLLLTWLIEEPSLFDKLGGLISADDFTKPLYRRAASLLFDEYKTTKTMTPARILNQFEEVEDQKEVAALFNTKLQLDDDRNVREKAFNETVRRVKRNSLEAASRNVTDMAILKRMIDEKARLQKLNIRIDT